MAGCPENPPIISSRIGVLSTLILASVMIPAYSAAIISYLTVKKPVLPFYDPDTYFKDGTYKTAALKHPITSYILTVRMTKSTLLLSISYVKILPFYFHRLLMIHGWRKPGRQNLFCLMRKCQLTALK